MAKKRTRAWSRRREATGIERRCFELDDNPQHGRALEEIAPAARKHLQAAERAVPGD